MVSKSQLDRLSSRIEALAPRPGTRFAVILARDGETEAQATARHHREHPEDGTAVQTVVVMFVTPKKARPAD
jgi:hypothetical protein